MVGRRLFDCLVISVRMRFRLNSGMIVSGLRWMRVNIVVEIIIVLLILW